MTIESTLNFLAFAALLAVATVPLLISLRVKTPTLRTLSLLLGLFALVHSFYHLADSLGSSFLADVLLEPVSIVFLLGFGFYYSKKGGL